MLQAGLLIEAIDGSAARPATVGMQDENDILVLAVEGAGDGVLDGPNFVPLLDIFGVVTARGEGDGGCLVAVGGHLLDQALEEGGRM